MVEFESSCVKSVCDEPQNLLKEQEILFSFTKAPLRAINKHNNEDTFPLT